MLEIWGKKLLLVSKYLSFLLEVFLHTQTDKLVGYFCGGEAVKEDGKRTEIVTRNSLFHCLSLYKPFSWYGPRVRQCFTGVWMPEIRTWSTYFPSHKVPGIKLVQQLLSVHKTDPPPVQTCTYYCPSLLCFALILSSYFYSISFMRE